MERDRLPSPHSCDTSLASWLRTEVAPAYDTHKANPERASSLQDAWKRFEARMDEIDSEDN